MTAPKHTPGPWRAVCRSSAYVEGQEWDEDEFLQWEVHGMRCPRGRGDYFQADAHLIAAAPELYGQHQADLVDLELLRGDIVRGATSSVLMIRIDDMIRRKNASIAKARGEANG